MRQLTVEQTQPIQTAWMVVEQNSKSWAEITESKTVSFNEMMKVILLSILAFCINAEAFSGPEPRKERSAGDESFDEKLEEGYQLVKDEPSADVTKKLLQQLHSMKEEIKDELTLTPEKDAELQDEMKDYVKIEQDHIQSMDDTIEEVNRKSKVDAALYQGDMILTKQQADEVIEDIKENEENRTKRQAFRDSRYPKTLWSNGVYYTFLPNATREAIAAFKEAVEVWKAETCIDFAESRTAPDRITLFQGHGCYSYVGRLGGPQGLSLGRGCEWVGTATHEIGHALGFFHTHSRCDRDDYITLYTQNFRQGWLSQFTKQTEHTNYNYNLTYDYGSIMHYGPTGVSYNGEPVMVPRDMKYISTLGTRFLSFYDKLMMNLHYGCLDKCKGSSSAACQNDGFPHPRDCSRCTCPSGYGGRLCNERPSGCGEVLNATTSYQTLEDLVGDKEARTSVPNYKFCHYWIQAPPGSKIEVVLDHYSDGIASDGCIFGGVEIKTGSDKRRTGYRFCSPKNAGTSFISTHSIVPIITSSRAWELKTVLRYRIAGSGPEPATEKPTAQSTEKPNPNCRDTSVCPSLLKWYNFCNNHRYSDSMKRQVCPKSCGFC